MANRWLGLSSQRRRKLLPHSLREACIIWEGNETWNTEESQFTEAKANKFRNTYVQLDTRGHSCQEKVECLAVREDLTCNLIDGPLLQPDEDGLFRRVGRFSRADKADFKDIVSKDVTIV